MIFRPFYLITDENPQGVHSFLCKYFYENNYPLTHEENTFINNTINELSKNKVKDLNSFLEPFKSQKNIYKELLKFKPNEKYDCFTNNKRVYIAALDGPTLALTIAYLNTFGCDNVQN